MEIPDVGLKTENSAVPPEPRAWGFWATSLFGLAAVAVSFFVQLLAIIIYVANYIMSNRNADFAGATQAVDAHLGLIVAVSTILEVAVGIPVIAGFVRLRRLQVREYLGLKRVKAKTLLTWLGLNFIYLVVAEGIRYFVKLPQSQNDVAWYNTSVSLPLFFAAVVVFAPLFEETLFRGFMFRGYSESRAGPVTAIILTAAFWALLHVTVSAYDMAVIFAGGLVLGFARWKTGSLWTTLAMHALWNAIAFVSIAATTSR